MPLSSIIFSNSKNISTAIFWANSSIYLSKVFIAENLTILFVEEIKSHKVAIVVFFNEGLTLGICITALQASILMLSSIL